MLLTLLACLSEEPASVRVGSLSVALLNPTSEDPWLGVQALRVDLTGDEGVFDSATFAMGEEVSLPDLDRFGRLMVELSGLDEAGGLLSYGRTAELVLGPDEELAATMLFLPVDRELSLALDLAPRSGHVALLLEDGAVLLFGGGTPIVERLSLDGVVRPDSEPRAPSWAGHAVGERRRHFIVGGAAQVGGQDVLVRDAFLVDPQGGTVEELPKLREARQPTCVAIFRPEFGLVLGSEEAAETLRQDPSTQEWEWTRVLIGGLDGSAVSSCVLVDDGRVALLGESSGVFDFRVQSSQENPKIAEAFQPSELPGSLAMPLPGGLIWTDAGLEIELDTLAQRGSVEPSLPPEQAVFVDGLRVALLSQDALELLDLGERQPGPVVDLSPREGARLTALPDGTLLITGPEPALLRPGPW